MIITYIINKKLEVDSKGCKDQIIRERKRVVVCKMVKKLKTHKN